MLLMAMKNMNYSICLLQGCLPCSIILQEPWVQM